MTNFEMIKAAKSVTELAVFFDSNITLCSVCAYRGTHECKLLSDMLKGENHTNCIKGACEWLEQEV